MNSNDTLNVRVYSSQMWSRLHEIQIYSQSADGRIFVAKPIEFQELKEEDRYTAQMPTLTVRDSQFASFMQQLVDQAWDLGVRPRFAKDGQPEVAALKYHLEDMRKLVFDEPQTNEKTVGTK